MIHKNPTPGPQPSILQGKRIVVTRAAAQTRSMCAKFTALGAHPIAFPTIETALIADTNPLDQAIQALDEYDWLIFTSANGVNFFLERLDKGQRSMVKGHLSIACVGTKTARALAERGLTPDFVPAKKFMAETLADGLGRVAGQKILIPQSVLARPTLAERLKAAGAQVDALPTYETGMGKPPAEAFAALEKGVDVVTFTSPSTFENFVALLGERAEALLRAAHLACIGPVTATAVQSAGYAVAIVPNEHTLDGLVAGIVQFYRET